MKTRLLALTAALIVTAFLPLLAVGIGKNTADAMKSGLLLGCAAQIDGMVSRIAQELNFSVSDLTLLSCGRYAGRVTPHCISSFTEMPHLLFEGLYRIHEKNR